MVNRGPRAVNVRAKSKSTLCLLVNAVDFVNFRRSGQWLVDFGKSGYPIG